MNRSPHSWWRRLALAVTIATAASLLAACSGGTTSPSTGSPGADNIDRNASLTFGYFEPATSMDPMLGTSSQDLPWLLPVYDTLLHTAKDGNVVSGLAKSFKLTGTAMTLTLRSGLTFQDGTKLDAAAVVANFQRAKTLPTSSVKADLSPVTGVKAIDETTVELSLSAPDAALPALLANRAGMMISPKAMTDGTNLATTPVGAGGWKLVNYAAGDHLDVTRFDGYWDPKSVMIKNLEIRLIADDNTRLNAVRAGEVDIAQLSATQVALAKSDSSITVRTDTALAVDHLGMNIAIKPFDNPKVREAINYAIDRKALMQGLYRGVGEVAWQPFPDGYFANDPKLDNKFAYSPKKAKQLLTEAGYPNGFSFDFKTNNQPFRVQATEAIAGMLKAVGITANIVPEEGPALLNAFYYEKTVPIYFTPWGGRADPSLTLDNLFGPTGLNNPSKVTAPALTDLLTRARETANKDERGPILQKASAEIMGTSRMIPLVFPGVTVGYRSNVVGYSTGITGKEQFLGVGVTKKK